MSDTMVESGEVPQTFETFIESERARLERERERLLSEQQTLQDQLDRIDNELRAIDAYDAIKSGRQPPRPIPTGRAGTRRSGMRNDLLRLIGSSPRGLTRAEILTEKQVAADDKSAIQSVSNALSALKRAGHLRQDEQGKYLLT